MQPTDFNRNGAVSRQRADSLIASHSVLRNTYLLLGLTLIFSAICAGGSMAAGFALPTGIGGFLLFMVGAYGLMFLTSYLRNSPLGIVSCFAFTGFMGMTLGPLLNAVMTLGNGGEIIMTALGGTGLIFFALSAYVLTTRKDMSFMGGFLFAGTVVVLIAMIAGLFFQVAWFHLALSSAFMLLSAGWILYETSAIIHGGERNYIMATISLYVHLYNMFVSLLHILSAFSSRD